MAGDLTSDQVQIKNDLLNGDACSAAAQAKMMPTIEDRLAYFGKLSGQKSADGNKEILVQNFVHEAHTMSSSAAAADPGHYADNYIGMEIDVVDRSGVLGRFAQPKTLYKSALNLSTLKAMPGFDFLQKCEK